jgi:membrane associated rhomboid family serine protease
MGLYDRDYERERNYYDDRPGFHVSGPLSVTTKLVIVMSAVYLVQLFTTSNDWLTNTFSLHADVLRRPWDLYQLVTYGFLHDPDNLKHILSNMIGLWFFGRIVEDHYGRREFLVFFLTAIMFAGIVWFVSELLAHGGVMIPSKLLGASGGIAAVLILFALNFPHQTVMFMMLFPMKAWVLAVLLLVYDVYGAMTRPEGGTVAFTAHLGGAGFAYLYYRYRWRLENWLPGGDLLKRLKPRPKLRVHDPDDLDANARRMDEILKKIHEHGEASLTRSERRFMEKASREYQKRRR